MRKNHSLKSIYKEVNSLLNEFIQRYKNKLIQNLLNENIGIEDLNKLSSILEKNIPYIIKFKENLSDKISSNNDSNNSNSLINKAMSDEKGQELKNKLLLRISEIIENEEK